MRNSIIVLFALVGVVFAVQAPTTSFQKVNSLCESKATVSKCKKAKVNTESGKKMSPCVWTGKKKKKCKIKACDSFAKKPSCAAAPYCNWSGKKNGKCIENVDVESDTVDACKTLKVELGEQTARVAEAEAKSDAATLTAQEAKAETAALKKYAVELEAKAKAAEARVKEVEKERDNLCTCSPTYSPTKMPTKTPTKLPTKTPTKLPTKTPTDVPTMTPTSPTIPPTHSPTVAPTVPPSLPPPDWKYYDNVDFHFGGKNSFGQLENSFNRQGGGMSFEWCQNRAVELMSSTTNTPIWVQPTNLKGYWSNDKVAFQWDEENNLCLHFAVTHLAENWDKLSALPNAKNAIAGIATSYVPLFKTASPTMAPTVPPTQSPTQSPTAPTTPSPTHEPTTGSPTAPTTPSPTYSPTEPLKTDKWCKPLALTNFEYPPSKENDPDMCESMANMEPHPEWGGYCDSEMSWSECPVTCKAKAKIDSIVLALEEKMPEYADEVEMIKWYMNGDVSIGCYGKQWRCRVSGFDNTVSQTLCTPPNSIIDYIVSGFRNKVTVKGGWGKMKMTASGFDNVVSVRDYNLTSKANGPGTSVTKLDSESNGPDSSCNTVKAQCSPEEEFWTDALDILQEDYVVTVGTKSVLNPGIVSSDPKRVEQTTEYLTFTMGELRTSINSLVTSYGMKTRPSLPSGTKVPTSSPTPKYTGPPTLAPTKAPTEKLQVKNLRFTFCSEWTSVCKPSGAYKGSMDKAYCQGADRCEEVMPTFTSEQLVRNYCLASNARCYESEQNRCKLLSQADAAWAKSPDPSQHTNNGGPCYAAMYERCSLEGGYGMGRKDQFNLFHCFKRFGVSTTC